MTRRNDEGFTLVELLVTTTLLGIVLSLATVGYISGPGRNSQDLWIGVARDLLITS